MLNNKQLAIFARHIGQGLINASAELDQLDEKTPVATVKIVAKKAVKKLPQAEALKPIETATKKESKWSPENIQKLKDNATKSNEELAKMFDCTPHSISNRFWMLKKEEGYTRPAADKKKPGKKATASPSPTATKTTGKVGRPKKSPPPAEQEPIQQPPLQEEKVAAPVEEPAAQSPAEPPAPKEKKPKTEKPPKVAEPEPKMVDHGDETLPEGMTRVPEGIRVLLRKRDSFSVVWKGAGLPSKEWIAIMKGRYGIVDDGPPSGQEEDYQTRFKHSDL
jgi:hypothetical protein